MKVNGIPFLMTIFRHIKFSSAGKLNNLVNKTIISHFKDVMNMCRSQGFHVTIILPDNQFETMRGDLADLGAIITVVSCDEHIPEVDQNNHTLKDHIRSTYNIIPFTQVPPVFIVELVYIYIFWSNMFALRSGIFRTQSPSELIINRKLDFNAL